MSILIKNLFYFSENINNNNNKELLLMWCVNLL